MDEFMKEEYCGIWARNNSFVNSSFRIVSRFSGLSRIFMVSNGNKIEIGIEIEWETPSDDTDQRERGGR